jgi:serine/threonine protein kinase
MGCSSSTEADPQPPAAKPASAQQRKHSSKAPQASKSSAGRPSTAGKHFNEVYKLGKQLGEGAFSVVKEGQNRHSGDSFAIKIVTKAKLSKEDEVALKDEIDVLQDMEHKHIIRLYDVFEEPQHYFMVTEKMMGGELFDRIVQKSYYNEREARDTCKILFSAIHYCHKKKVAHRDLKPENLLLTSENDDSDIKIADFGFAKRVHKPKSLTTQCGTPGYVAAEILEGKPYDTQADIWSIGVIVYILLGGYPPFIESNQRTLFRKIRRGQYEFHPEYWGQVSEDAKDLIRNLLNVDPDKRFDSNMALANKWIGADAETLASLDLGFNLEKFKKTNAKRKFKAAVSTVIAANKLNSLGVNFRDDLE